MNNVFKQDYYRMTGKPYRIGLRSFIQLLGSHQIRYMRIWRKANKKMTAFRRFQLKRYATKYGLEISPTARIGKGLYLGHPYNITVGVGTIIGNNVNLHKGCTLGRENRGKREGSPIIGNCVSIGINATVVGNVTIRDDVLIAPNAYVNFDVPSHSVVVGNPGVIHHRDNAIESYVAFKV